MYHLKCAPNEDAYPRSLIRVFAIRMQSFSSLGYPNARNKTFDQTNAKSDLNFRWVHMFAGCTCSRGAQVRVMHNFDGCTCSLGAHVRCLHMFAGCTCSLDAHVRWMHMFAWCICLLGAHVR